MLMAPKEIPKSVGVEVEDIDMDEDAVGVLEGLDSQQRNLTALCKEWSAPHVLSLMVVLCSCPFGELQIVVHGCQKITPDFCYFLLEGSPSMKTLL